MPAGQQRPNFSDANLKGAFFGAFDDATAPSYLPAITTSIDSKKAYEKYAWLGTAPVMREWKGGRQIHQPNESEWTIWNEKFENSLGIPVDDVRRDDTGQHELLAASLGQRAAENPILILSKLIESGESSPCFDGQYFFSNNHQEGNSGLNNNKIQVQLSGLPVLMHGSGPTSPSDDEMEKVIQEMIKALYTMKDDQGQPVNQTAQKFALVYPVNLMNQVLAALNNQTMGGGRQNTLASSKFQIDPYCDARLGWSSKLALFRTDHPVKPFIHQVEVDNEIQSITDGDSEYVIMNDEYFFGVKRIEAVGYGDYKKAVQATMI